MRLFLELRPKNLFVVGSILAVVVGGVAAGATLATIAAVRLASGGGLGMSPETLVSLLLGSAVGAAVTWIVTVIYYRRASVDLRHEARNLRAETESVRAEMEKVRSSLNAFAHVLFRAEKIDAHWSADGELLGIATSRTQRDQHFESGLFQGYKGQLKTVEYEPIDTSAGDKFRTIEFNGVQDTDDFRATLNFNTSYKLQPITDPPDNPPPDYPPAY